MCDLVALYIYLWCCFVLGLFLGLGGIWLFIAFGRLLCNFVLTCGGCFCFTRLRVAWLAMVRALFVRFVACYFVVVIWRVFDW